MKHFGKWIPSTLILVMLSACNSGDTDYDASGIFETTEVIVSSKSTGEIVQFTINEGDKITVNQVLGCVDTTQLANKRKQLMATLSATDSRRLNETRQLASLKQQIANLNEEKSRYEALLKADAATEKQLDDINYQIGVLERQLSATAEQVNSSNKSVSGQSESILAQIAQIDYDIANSVITTPIEGVVLTKYAEPGEFATIGRALFKVGNIHEMKLRAYVSADMLTTLKIGQAVKVYVDLGESERKEVAGIVSWISSEAEFTPKTIQTRDERSNLVYAIKVSVANDGTIKRGMYGDVKF